jgi:hypothetical protein
MMKKYKVKLLTLKENAYKKLVSVVRLIIIADQGMEVSVFNALGGNEDVENIQFFEELTDFAKEESMKFFLKVYDTRNKKGTSIVFRITTEHSHIEWRKLLEDEKSIQDLKLYIGEYKLESTETQIIGIVIQKHPEMTHTRHFETTIMKKLAVGSLKQVVERIYPKSASGFENPVKTDVLAIRVKQV